jgi:16S rRNA (uracil1498-N3)-methyltransferase
MRAVYCPIENFDGVITLEGESFHHLANVVRLKIDESVLLLNGLGLKAFGKIISITKKQIQIEVANVERFSRKFNFDLAIGVPKKDALELCLRQATEIGFKNIFLVESEFSNCRDFDVLRLEKVMVSALEQSNSAYMPKLIKCSWDKIIYSDYNLILKLDSQTPARLSELPDLNSTSPVLMMIGPEGGFSPDEMTYFTQIPNLQNILLPTGILRTPTALSVGAGWLLRGLMD